MAPPSLRREIHLWVPDVDDRRGGIEAFSAAMMFALGSVCPDGVRVLGKHLWMDSGATPPPGVRAVGSGGWPMRMRTPVFAVKLLWSAFRHRPALIICTHLHFAPVARLLRRLTGTPYWVIAHGIEAWSIKRAGRIQALRAANRIFAVSRYTRERLAAVCGLQTARIEIMPNCVDDERFRPGPRSSGLLQRHGIASDAKIILTVGRLASSEQYKGYDRVIRALPAVLAAVPLAHYLLVGEGGDQERIRMLVRECGVDRSVTLAGFVAASELADYYNLCDVFAMPSQGEGFGIVFLEALACGKPVLGGNRDGSVDALDGGALGALVDPDDVDAIAHTLVQILLARHPLKIMADGEALHNRVVELFGRARFRQRLNEQLASLEPIGSLEDGG